jgi:hypothetical protein
LRRVAYGFDDSAGGSDGLEDGLECFFWLGLVALELDVTLVIGDSAGEGSGDKEFDILRIVYGASIKVDYAVGIDGYVGGDSHLGCGDVLGLRKFYGDIGLVLDGFTADEEKDDE